MNFIQVTNQNQTLLDNFPFKDVLPHFRYFANRCIGKAVRTHIYTVVAVVNDKTVAYGHIEYESKYWLGICVLPNQQGKGYGRDMVKHLIDTAKEKRLPKLDLTVDSDNVKAISLYKKVGFVESPLREGNIIRMSLLLDDIHKVKDNSVTVPVSYGEAIDKLAILEIKFTKMDKYKKDEVQKEYDEVLGYVNHLMNENTRFYYDHLVKCSTIIWNQQVDFRNNKGDRVKLCDEIIFENDRRYRLKNKINNLLGSFLMEQKEGYAVKKAFVLTHLGLGDLLTSNGIVRYLATTHENVTVVCKKKYLNEIQLIYSDDKTIDFYPVDDDVNISPRYGFDKNKFSEITEGYNVYLTGSHKGATTNNIPFCFYDHVGLDPKYFWDFFHIPETEQSDKLFSLLQGRQYIVIHNTNSKGNVFTVKSVEDHMNVDKNNILIINLNGNVYDKDHPDHSLAQSFVFKPLVHYKKILINADSLYLSDSCIFCMAVNLKLKSNKCYYVTRRNNPRDYSYFYQEKYRPDSKLNRQIFKPLKI